MNEGRAMTGKHKTRRKSSAAIVPGAEQQEWESEIPAWLARSGVYRRMPVAARGRLDAAILLRPKDCPTLEAIAEKFKLAERYGISRAALRAYAGKLEQLVRPMAAAQVLAGVLGCLPVSYRRKLAAGSEVMLLSRLVKTLHDEKSSTLAVADLAKLAVLLKTMSQPNKKSEKPKPRQKTPPREPLPPTPESAASDSEGMAETVRTLYGLSWPPGKQT